MNTHYFVELDGQQFGPYELEQMKTFGLMPNVQVYSTLSEEWAPVESYLELVDFIAKGIIHAKFYAENEQKQTFMKKHFPKSWKKAESLK